MGRGGFCSSPRRCCARRRTGRAGRRGDQGLSESRPRSVPGTAKDARASGGFGGNSVYRRWVQGNETSRSRPRKWQLVPRLKEIVESAEYIRRNTLTKKRKDDIVAFHWLEADVQLNGKSLRVGLHIAEDSKGNKFYNLNHDLEDFQKRREALAGHLENKRGPQTDFFRTLPRPSLPI